MRHLEGGRIVSSLRQPPSGSLADSFGEMNWAGTDRLLSASNWFVRAVPGDVRAGPLGVDVVTVVADPAPAGSSDADLLAAVAGGSGAAFEELRQRYFGAVERVCRSMVSDEAEDCVQEVFVRVWRKARLFDRRRGSAAGWLLQVARRTAVNIHARRPPTAMDFPELETAAFEAAEVDRFWLAAALERLPTQERRVVELAYFDDLSQTAIAAELGVPLGSVKSWTRRGLNRLATLLGEEGR